MGPNSGKVSGLLMNDNSNVVFGQKIWQRRKSEMLHSYGITASSYVAKFRGDNFTYFHAETAK